MRPFTVLQVIPTGLGAEWGGYAGDGAPVTHLLAAASDVLITHPNALNAAGLLHKTPNTLYVEGYGLDRFVEGEWALRPVRSNRIGIILDASASEMRTSLLNVANALRASAGISIMGLEVTEEPVNARVVVAASGATQGEVENPQTLLDAAEKLIARGAEALAIACQIHQDEDADEAYVQGQGADPIGGIEAILSHLVVSRFQIPAAHAPAELPWLPEGVVDPRLAAEACTHSYLPCVLMGLHQAPRFVPISEARPGDLTCRDLDALVAPASCFGGVPMRACHLLGIPLIAVDNPTVLSVTPDKLGIDTIPARDYLEAAGILLALKEGISLETLRRPLSSL